MVECLPELDLIAEQCLVLLSSIYHLSELLWVRVVDWLLVSQICGAEEADIRHHVIHQRMLSSCLNALASLVHKE